MKNILLTDAQQRKTLAAARSLGRRGIRVIAAEETRFTPTAYSRYCSKHLVSPNPGKEPEAYFYWLKGVLQKYSCDVFFPMDDDTLSIAIKNRDILKEICAVPLPPTESYLLAVDKGESVRTASDSGVSCPKTTHINSIEEIYNMADRLSYPVVIKPRRSSGSRGIRTVSNKDEFLSEYHKVHQDYPYPLVQEYIDPGERYDVCLLYDRNNCLKASFLQKEIRHFPLDKGPSTIQESVYYPEIMEMAVTIMKRLPWYGVVEIEFMKSKTDGKIYFMEINPRFWGSLQMAVLSGVDFPWLLYRLVNGEDIKGVFTYKTGVKCRWLLPGDILHFITNNKRCEMDPPFLAGRKHNVYDDIISREDPCPSLGFLLAGLRYLVDWEMWKIMFFR